MKDTVIVGGGIVGCTITKVLQAQGHEVTIVDCGRPMAGTGPSGGHLKPSWFAGMAKAEYGPAMELLDKVWGLHSDDFVVRPTGIKTTVYRVDTDVVMQTPRHIAEVASVHNAKWPVLVLTSGEEWVCRLLVVAAGVWTNDLVPGIEITRKQGVSFRMPGVLDRPFIKPWAPYKQVVAHQQGTNEIWVGDGSAILPDNWKDERTAQCLARCRKALGTGGQPLRILSGLRPYCKVGKDPCLVQRLSPRLWAVTGAAKLGTIAAGWAAGRIAHATD